MAVRGGGGQDHIKNQNLTVADGSFNPITKTSCRFLSLLNHLFKFRIPAFWYFFKIMRPFLLLSLDNYPINFLFLAHLSTKCSW